MLDTALPIVWIEVRYAESQELWGLVVQKARGFLEMIVPGEEHREELFQILRGELLNGDEDGEEKGSGDFDAKRRVDSDDWETLVKSGSRRGERNKVGNEGNGMSGSVSGRESQTMKSKAADGSASVEQTPSISRSVRESLTKFLSLGKKK